MGISERATAGEGSWKAGGLKWYDWWRNVWGNVNRNSVKVNYSREKRWEGREWGGRNSWQDDWGKDTGKWRCEKDGVRQWRVSEMYTMARWAADGWLIRWQINRAVYCTAVVNCRAHSKQHGDKQELCNSSIQLRNTGCHSALLKLSFDTCINQKPGETKGLKGSCGMTRLMSI